LRQVWIVCSLTFALHGGLGNRGSIRLAEDRDYLLVGESALPHRLFLCVGEPSFKKSTVRKSRAGQSRYSCSLTYGCFGVLYSTSFWNGFQTVS
jgi:hypothetical protein